MLRDRDLAGLELGLARGHDGIADPKLLLAKGLAEPDQDRATLAVLNRDFEDRNPLTCRTGRADVRDDPLDGNGLIRPDLVQGRHHPPVVVPLREMVKEVADRDDAQLAERLRAGGA